MAYLELQPGDLRSVGTYRLLGRLDSSGMGQAYLALSPSGQTVALKLVAPAVADDPSLRRVFRDGVAAARMVDSPYTAALVDADTEAPRPWIATEYVPGQTLGRLVSREGPLPVPLVVALTAALAEGLRDIHAAGVVHRDLKPANIIVGGDVPRIVDFGIAVPSGERAVSDEGLTLGTPGFMSPEQVAGRGIGTASDIFSLGGVLFFAAVGRGPFENPDPVASMYRIVSGEPDLADMPPVLRPLAVRCLAKDQAARPSAADVVAAAYSVAADLDLDAVALRSVMASIPGWNGPGPAGPAAAGGLPLSPSTASIAGRRSVAQDRRPAAELAAPVTPGPALVAVDTESAGERGGRHADESGGASSWYAPPAPPAPAPPAPGPAAEEPGHRFLTGVLPERAPSGSRLSLLVLITLRPGGNPNAAMKEFAVPPTGRWLTITVSAPGLIPLGDLEQRLFVPFAADSEPIRFGFRTGSVGLHTVVVRAFAGGTFLGELAVQISVEHGAALEEGRGQHAVLAGLAAEPGEVTLQVSRTEEDRYSFQLIGEALYPVEITRRLAGDPAQVVGALIDELRAMSANESAFASPALVRNRIRNLGAQLWGDVVPESVRRQFWAQGDRIKLFTIASDMDTVPWELLYPADGENDNGFLVEQFPVVRRVYGQGRARVLRLEAGAAYVVPPGSPANAMAEVDAVRGILPSDVFSRGVHSSLADFTQLLESMPSVLHFACHNTFTGKSGSVISLDGGPLRPSDLAIAVQQRGLAAISPLVFLNACRTAGDIPGFMQLIGWARQFMSAGAGAFIGSLWAVRSSSAKVFAEEFYRALVRDQLPLGAASVHARRAISGDAGDPTWLAYTVYGNPSAAVVHGPTAAL